MKIFTLDSENAISVVDSLEDVPVNAKAFTSLEELKEATSDHADEHLLVIWNSLAGVKPAKKIPSRGLALSNIWKRIQSLGEPAPETAAARAPRATAAAKGPKAKKSSTGKKSAGKAPKPAKEAKAKKPAKEAKPKKERAKTEAGLREGSKAAQVVEMLKRPEGATLDAIMKKFDWLPHTTRALMSAGGSLAKAGYKIESFKTDKGDRAYRIA